MSSNGTFKILVTTDNHLGYGERDHRRGDDSFTTFEEILRAARVEHDVDMVLLGGDLFHDNKPSLGCMARTCSLFRKYVLGDRPIDVALLSDPAKNFPTHALPLANFQDPNVNVALPIFAIHGNHDDPVGGTSALDILATNSYLNYFGHVSSLEDIVVEPVLLQKGDTYIALFGLGNVRDERLHRCFRLKKVHFVHPKPVAGCKWFNILIVHQNRGVRGFASKGGILEGMLAGFGLDLVIWGNEHEQLMIPQPSQGFDIVQPGSSVLTALSAQECNPKQYGILEVRGTSYRLTPFPLRSVRPVVRRTIELWRDNPKGRTLDAVEDFLRSVVDEMLDEAEEQISRIPDDVLAFHPNLKYPLMRLAVDFTDAASAPFPQPNLNRFGQQYMDVIANPGELLRPIKPKPQQTLGNVVGNRNRTGADGIDDPQSPVVPVGPLLNTLDIRTKVAEVFNQNARDACALLSEPEVSAAVYAFAEKGERDAIDERIMELLNMTQKTVWRKLGNGSTDSILKPDVIAAEAELYKAEVNKRYARSLAEEGTTGMLQHAASRVDGVEDPADAARGVQQRLSRLFDTNEQQHQQPPAAAVDPFLNAQTKNVSMLVSQAVRDHQRTTAAVVKTENEEAEDEGRQLEELPGDGLDRVTVDHLVAQVLKQDAAVGVKRPRGVTVVDVDDEDEGGSHPAPPPAPQPVSPKPRRGRKAAAPAAPAPKSSAASGMPALNLVADNNNAAKPRKSRAAEPKRNSPPPPPPPPAGGAVLDLLSKWGSQQ